MGRSVDELYRGAVHLRELIRGLDPDDHRTRALLLSARKELRAEAAQEWHRRGWRPITQRASDHPGVR